MDSQQQDSVGLEPLEARRWPRWMLAAIGMVMILGGALLASAIQTSGGVRVSDIRFNGAGGTEMSALLYVPATATPATPAPGILAVHGYINSRETQDGFAIEFARRGYVVLATDQTGHGYSGGKAFSNGFGGPDGLAYLRSLPFVDKDEIGLEGHSMGGWTVLAAAAAMPDAYRAIVLEGSSTGAPYAKEGTPGWPRNLGLVYSRYDEFSQLMWGVGRAMDVGQSVKLKQLFGTSEAVQAGRLYGSIPAGTARYLVQPSTTHPGDHISAAAIGAATDWFARTLAGGHPRPAGDQIWFWKEIGTGLGLLGFVPLVLGLFDLMLALPFFASLRGNAVAAVPARDARWWRGAAMAAVVPVLIFFPVFIGIFLLVPATAFLPQTVTTQVTVWALAGAGLTWFFGRGRSAGRESGIDWLKTILLALAVTLVAYLVLALVQHVLTTDLRFWIMAIKPPSVRQWLIALIYVVPMTVAFLMTGRVLRSLTVAGDRGVARYISPMLVLSGGFVVLLGLVYGTFFATGTLASGFDPLSTIIAIQFVPVLAAVAAIITFGWSRTGSHRPGAMLGGMLVTLYVVAGTATQG
ncbi:lysophospholipase [Sphingomonas sp. QA11]|uniref:alpha/beta hydrolase family protein n=1 Tax=Sphingomonas sp. QA11 TaxID=2950605 RepID=UPI00234BCFD1|nr:alpha/beta fold hydrolase [Sphingomonas sp. QA11]WCM28897.1 lysophospholipase [Sphingomonas sp. QA11]